MIHTLLLADDNDDMRTVLGHQLQARGYRIIMASNGEQAVEKARNERPDLVLLDVLMPGLDGTEAREQLKLHDSTRDIPVIFLTSLVDGNDPSVPVGPAASCVMAKSTPLEVLVAKIQEILKEKKR